MAGTTSLATSMLQSIVLHILILWIPITSLLFVMFRTDRAMMISLFAGWLFLPVAGVRLEGLPDIGKPVIIQISIIIAMLLFDLPRVLAFRPKWIDLFVVVFCSAAFVSSFTNDLGLYDAVSSAANIAIRWGLPYFIGRVYLASRTSIRDFCVALVIAGLIYIPFMLFEVRMSPQLHKWVYGYSTQAFRLNVRLGGYRPVVFMSHGLMTSLFICASFLSAYGLWRSRCVRYILNVPMIWAVALLMVTAVLTRSLGALFLVSGIVACVIAARCFKLRIVFITLVFVVPVYTVARSTGSWSGDGLLAAVEKISEARATSLEVRFDNERVLVDHAMQRPFFGWARWGRNHVQLGVNQHTITDGWWVIVLGQHGTVGALSWMCMMLVPSLIVLARYDRSQLLGAGAAPVLTIALLPILFSLDCLFNAMINPIYIVAVGGAASVASLGGTAMQAAAAKRRHAVGTAPVNHSVGATDVREARPKSSLDRSNEISSSK